MAQIIMFPSGEVQTDERAPVLEPATPKPTGRSVVVAIRGRRIPRRNRDEDEQTIMFARIAASASARAEEAGKKEWGSEAHRAFLGMSRITDKLPRNNLRILTTPDDIVEGLWRLWRRLSLLNLEWRLCEGRRMDAVHDHDDARRHYWSAKQDEADRRRWDMYERVARIPAQSLTDFKSYKLDRRFGGGMGCLDWMRKWRPEIAVVLDEEQERLETLKIARKIERATRKQQG